MEETDNGRQGILVTVRDKWEDIQGEEWDVMGVCLSAWTPTGILGKNGFEVRSFGDEVIGKKGDSTEHGAAEDEVTVHGWDTGACCGTDGGGGSAISSKLGGFSMGIWGYSWIWRM